MLNCRPLIEEATKKRHTDEQFSRYNEEFRYDIYKAAKKAYQKLTKESRAGIRPLHRTKY